MARAVATPSERQAPEVGARALGAARWRQMPTSEEDARAQKLMAKRCRLWLESRCAARWMPHCCARHSS